MPLNSKIFFKEDFAIGSPSIFSISDYFDNADGILFSYSNNKYTNKINDWIIFFDNTGSSNWSSVDSDFFGGKLTAVSSSGTIWKSSDFGNTWNSKGPIQYNILWQDVAMNRDGQWQTAVANSGNNSPFGIWTSNNYGDTWSQKVSTTGFTSIALNRLGNVQIATQHLGGIWTSKNYGSTWYRTNSQVENWKQVSVSEDGKFQTAVSYMGYISISENSGDSWRRVTTTAKGWAGVSLSSDGKYQSAIERLISTPGYIWNSSGYGAELSWNQNNQAGLRLWTSIAVSSDGKVRVASAEDISSTNPGGIWISTDYGLIWNKKSTVSDCKSLAISEDGKNIIALQTYGRFLISNDSGNNWIQRQTDPTMLDYPGKWKVVNTGQFNPPAIGYYSNAKTQSSNDLPLNSKEWVGVSSPINGINYINNRLSISDGGIKNVYPPTGGECYVKATSDKNWIIVNNEYQNFRWHSGDMAYTSSSIGESGFLITGLPTRRWIYHPVLSGTVNSTTIHTITGYWVDMPDHQKFYPSIDNPTIFFNKTGVRSTNLNMIGGYSTDTSLINSWMLTIGSSWSIISNFSKLTGLNSGQITHWLPPKIETVFWWTPNVVARDPSDPWRKFDTHTLESRSVFNPPPAEEWNSKGFGYLPGPTGYPKGNDAFPLGGGGRDNLPLSQLMGRIHSSGTMNYECTITGQWQLGKNATGLYWFPCYSDNELPGKVRPTTVKIPKSGVLALNGTINDPVYGKEYKYPTPSGLSTYWEWIGFTYSSGYLFSLPNTGGNRSADWGFTYGNHCKYSSMHYPPGKALVSDWFPNFKIIPLTSEINLEFNPLSGALQQDVTFSLDYNQLLPSYSMNELEPIYSGASISVDYDPATNKYVFSTLTGINNSQKIWNNLVLDRQKEYRFIQKSYANSNKRIYFHTINSQNYTPEYNFNYTHNYALTKINPSNLISNKIYYSSLDALTTGELNLAGRTLENLYSALLDEGSGDELDVYIFDTTYATYQGWNTASGTCCRTGPKYRFYQSDGTSANNPNLFLRKGSWVRLLRIEYIPSNFTNEPFYFYTGTDYKKEFKFSEASGFNRFSYKDFPGVTFYGQIPTDPYKGQFWELIQFYVPEDMNTLNIKYGSSGIIVPKDLFQGNTHIVDNTKYFNNSLPSGQYVSVPAPIFSGNIDLVTSDRNFKVKLPIVLSGNGIVDYIKPKIQTTLKKDINSIKNNLVSPSGVLYN